MRPARQKELRNSIWSFDPEALPDWLPLHGVVKTEAVTQLLAQASSQLPTISTADGRRSSLAPYDVKTQRPKDPMSITTKTST